MWKVSVLVFFTFMKATQGTELFLFAFHRTAPDIDAAAGETGGYFDIRYPNQNEEVRREVSPFSNAFVNVLNDLSTTSGIEDAAFLVESSDGIFNVYGYGNQDSYFTPLPIGSLGTRYIISSCYTTGSTSVLVIATHSQATDVTIDFRMDGTVDYAGVTYNDSDSLTVSLGQYKTLTVTSDSDISKTVVTSVATVAVYTGMWREDISKTVAYEQMPPVEFLAQEYVLAVDDNDALYQLKIISEETNVQILFNNGSTATIDQSRLYSRTLQQDQKLHFTTTKPVMPMLCRYDGIDSGMLVVPEVTHGRTQTGFFGYSEPIRIVAPKSLSSVQTRPDRNIIWEDIPQSDYKVGSLSVPRVIWADTPYLIFGLDNEFIYNGGYPGNVLTLTGGGTVNEAAGSVTLTLTRLLASAELNVTASTSPTGTYPITADDIDMTVQTVTFPQGTKTVTFDVIINDNQIIEPPEEFKVIVSSPGTIPDLQTTVTIANDDPEVLTITHDPNVSEAAGSVSFNLTRQGTFEELVVNATVTPSGIYPVTEDDIDMTGQTVTFWTGEDTVTFNVTINDNDVAEPDEEFTVTVDYPGSDTDLETTVTITNDDRDVVTLPSFLAQYENAGTEEIIITRTVADKEVTVQVNTRNGTAGAGTDYTALIDHDVTFEAGSLTANFSVELLDDEQDEGDEIFTLTVSGVTVTTTESYTYIVVDNEGGRAFLCHRLNQFCWGPSDICVKGLPFCQCVGTPAREGDMCNIITEQKNGPACAGVDCGDHGVCLDDAGSTSCACYPGYYGDNCEHYFLWAYCSKEGMIFIANPHGNFTGKIYVESKGQESECTATDLPVADPDDNIDDSLRGFYLEVPHNSTACGEVKPEADSEPAYINYIRRFRIQYIPLLETAYDQIVIVSCRVGRNSVITTVALITDTPVPFIPESVTGTFSPLTLSAGVNGEPAALGSTVSISAKLCLTIDVHEGFGGIEIIDIEFSNSLPADPKTLRIFSAGCSLPGFRDILIKDPFYPISGNKRRITFCITVFKFTNSVKLTTRVKIKLCLDAANCRMEPCTKRRRRQADPSSEETVEATFNIQDPSQPTKVSQQETTDVGTVNSTVVCSHPMEFVPTVIGLGLLTSFLVLLSLSLTYKLVHDSPRPSGPQHVNPHTSPWADNPN